MNQREPNFQTVGHGCRSLGTTGVGADNDTVGHVQVGSDPSQHAGLGIQIVNGHVEESLDLAGVQVHGDDVVAAGCLQHVGHQLCGDWSSTSLLFVLAGVREVGEDGGDASCRGGFAGVDGDEEFHEAVVDVVWTRRLQDEH